jgi:phosphomannomutase/phosphoglucomutase
VSCPEAVKFALVDRVRDELRKNFQVMDVDGVRVVFPDGWGLLRASNTGPVLVLRFEAESEPRLEEIRALVEGTLERAKESL